MSGTPFPPSDRYLSDLGAGSVLGLGVLGLFAVFAAGVLAVFAVLPVKHALQGTADNAALAAADVASGRLPGQPCQIAADLAEVGEAELQTCSIDNDASVRLEVTATNLGFRLSARSRAGSADGY